MGYLGFSKKDPQGILVEGFEEPIVIAANCNYPYQVRYVENAGYTKYVDLLVYKIIIPDEIPDFYKIYAFTPLNEQEMNDIARRYFPILDPIRR